MKTLTILIPNKKLPKFHDLFTIQCKNICEQLQKMYNIQLIWVIVPPEEMKNSENGESRLVDSRNFTNAVDVINSAKPDLILINGSLDFHNVEMAMVAKFKKIPLVTLFYRNLSHVTTISTFKTIKTRFRAIFSDKALKIHSPEKPIRFNLFKFYVEQTVFLNKTLEKIHYNFLDRIKFFLFYIRTVIFSYEPSDVISSGDINLCSNEEWRDRLIKFGFNNSFIIISGDPYFDKLFLELENKKRRRLPKNKIKVLFCTSTMYNHGLSSKNDEYELITSTVKEILKHDEFEVSIKVHPSMAVRSDFEELITKRIQHDVTLYQNENLAELINNSDVMITYGSSGAIYHGVLLQIPIINLEFGTEVTSFNNIIDEKVITSCHNLDSLHTEIKKSLERDVPKKDYEKFIETQIGKFDGKCSERAATVIFNLIQEKNI